MSTAKCVCLVLPTQWLDRKCCGDGDTPTVQRHSIIHLPKVGNGTCYKCQEYIKPPPLQQNKMNSGGAATKHDRCWWLQLPTLLLPWRTPKDRSFIELVQYNEQRAFLLLVRSNDPPPPFRSLPLHIHLLRVVQRAAWSIRQTDELPAPSWTTPSLRPKLLDHVRPSIVRSSSAVFVALHLPCHLQNNEAWGRWPLLQTDCSIPHVHKTFPMHKLQCSTTIKLSKPLSWVLTGHHNQTAWICTRSQKK